MREILFRGKRKDNGEWVEGDSLIHSMYKKGDVCIGVVEGLEIYSVIPETIGQYTGLTDKNGKKIFEGDIVKFGKYLYQITFECGSFALLDKQGLMIAKIGGLNDHCYPLMNLYVECCWENDWAYDIEIIRNKHNNFELLKECEG